MDKLNINNFDIFLSKLEEFYKLSKLPKLDPMIDELEKIIEKYLNNSINIQCPYCAEKIDIFDINSEFDFNQNFVTIVSINPCDCMEKDKIERDLISLRTREGLNAARARGVKLGRKKGVQVKSKFDLHKDDIRTKLKMGVPVAKIARDLECSITGLNYYIRSRRLNE